MKIEILKITKCPFCSFDLEVGDVYRNDYNEIIYGTLKCKCGEYPILEGIPVIKKGPDIKGLINLVKNKKYKDALGLYLCGYKGIIFLWVLSLENESIQIKTLKGIFYNVSRLFANYTYKKYSKKKSFIEIISSIYDKGSEDYQKYRMSAQTFWLIYPFIPILKNQKRVLDIGSGIGYTAFVIAPYVKEMICLDPDFKSLLITKRYFSNDAEFFCADANYSLLFKDNSFSSVLMLDSFHYIRSKALLAKEIERISSPEGIALFLHLHNSPVNNVAKGEPLSAFDWKKLFTTLKIKIMPEEDIIRIFFEKNKLDLTKDYSKEILNKSNLVMIGTRNQKKIKVYNKITKFLFENKDVLIINPIYDIEKKNCKLFLKIRFPSEYFKKEYPLSEKYLPKKLVIDKKISKLIKNKRELIIPIPYQKNDMKRVNELIKNFIIVNVPKNYI